MTRGGQQSAIMNAAEETAFEAFVEEKIGFLEMADVAEAVMEEMTGWGAAAATVEDVFACDAEARLRAGEWVRGKRAA